MLFLNKNLQIHLHAHSLKAKEKQVRVNMKLIKNLNAFTKLFTDKSEFQKEDTNGYLSQINIPILTVEQSQTFEGPITESEILNALKSMSNNKSPGNNGLTKVFYKTFIEKIKITLCNSTAKSNKNGELMTPQKDAVTKFIEKKQIRTRKNLNPGDQFLC